MANEAKKGQQKLGKLLKKGQQNFEVTEKRSTKYFSKADTINLVQFLMRRVRRSPRKLGAAMRRVQRISVGRRPAQWMEIFPTGGRGIKSQPVAKITQNMLLEGNKSDIYVPFLDLLSNLANLMYYCF